MTRQFRAALIGVALIAFFAVVAHYAPHVAAQSAPSFSNTGSFAAVTTRVCSDVANVGSQYTQTVNGGLSYLCLETGNPATLGTAAFQWLPFVGQQGYITGENGANNAIATPVGVGPALSPGTILYILLAHSLQAGADTLAYQGGTATAIKSHRNTANNIGTAYATGGVIQLEWDGTQFEDMSQ